MLGLRGCRLGITFPEITEMQVRAIIEAAVAVKAKGGNPHPEIMIPLIGSVEEMRNQTAIVRRVADEVFKEKKTKVDYMVGTMIELPRAALTADQIAEEAEFFCSAPTTSRRRPSEFQGTTSTTSCRPISSSASSNRIPSPPSIRLAWGNW